MKNTHICDTCKKYKLIYSPYNLLKYFLTKLLFNQHSCMDVWMND